MTNVLSMVAWAWLMLWAELVVATTMMAASAWASSVLALVMLFASVLLDEEKKLKKK